MRLSRTRIVTLVMCKSPGGQRSFDFAQMTVDRDSSPLRSSNDNESFKLATKSIFVDKFPPPPRTEVIMSYLEEAKMSHPQVNEMVNSLAIYL